MRYERHRYEGTDFEGIYKRLDAGAFDVVASGATITAHRETEALFCPPYLRSGQSLVVNVHRDPAIRSTADLRGRVIGVQDGNTSQPVAEELRRQGAVARRQGVRVRRDPRRARRRRVRRDRRLHEARAGAALAYPRPAGPRRRPDRHHAGGDRARGPRRRPRPRPRRRRGATVARGARRAGAAWANDGCATATPRPPPWWWPHDPPGPALHRRGRAVPCQRGARGPRGRRPRPRLAVAAGDAGPVRGDARALRARLARRAPAPVRDHPAPGPSSSRPATARRSGSAPATSCWPRTPPAAGIPGGWSTTSPGAGSM